MTGTAGYFSTELGGKEKRMMSIKVKIIGLMAEH